MSEKAGLGDTHATFNVYIANQPNMPQFSSLDRVRALSCEDIQAIGQACGNGWRKVFNVYAKLVYALGEVSGRYSCWQAYRDELLLQPGSGTSLLFSPPDVIDSADATPDSGLHIVMGRTYAKALLADTALEWLDSEFAINRSLGLIVCPYFDYRQLSNVKIIRLVELIHSLNKTKLAG